jgi:hypothetical protein
MPQSDDKPPRMPLDPEDARRIRRHAMLLVARFPHLQSVSLQLLERDETFWELCEEYAACTEVIERLTDAPADEAMRREFSALRLRVEGELLRYLSDHGPKR